MQAVKRLLSTKVHKSSFVFVSKARCISTTPHLEMPIKVGDKLPAVDLFENDPGTKVNTSELFGKGRSVIFAVPGAFTPTCSKDHLPGFVNKVDELKAKGIDRVACISVNDPFVMAAWGKGANADGKIRMLADTNAEFSKKVDLTVDLSAVLGTLRSKRYAMVVKDGVVEALQLEPDGTGLSCSSASDILALVK